MGKNTAQMGRKSKRLFHKNTRRSGRGQRRKTQRGGAKKFDEIGEGRSTSIYITPQCDDTAVLITFYNPANFKRILNNALYIISILKEKNIPCFVAECVFAGRKQQIPDADLVLHSKSYMFYKEQLINKLEKIVPEKYTKIVALDGDIIFDSPDWLDQVSMALDTYDVIQPYDKACWLMPGNKIIRSWKHSYGHAITKKVNIDHTNIHLYHPGFAWAFRRKTFRDLGGFYANAIIGGGDMLFTFNFFQDSIPEYWYKDAMITTVPIEAWPEYHANFVRVAPKIGIIDIRALHLFHGLSLNRQYKTRYQKVAHHLDKKWDDYIIMNPDGLTEFKDAKFHDLLLPYFKERNEDVPLSEALEHSKRGVVATVASPNNGVPEEEGQKESV